MCVYSCLYPCSVGTEVETVTGCQARYRIESFPPMLNIASCLCYLFRLTTLRSVCLSLRHPSTHKHRTQQFRPLKEDTSHLTSRNDPHAACRICSRRSRHSQSQSRPIAPPYALVRFTFPVYRTVVFPRIFSLPSSCSLRVSV